MKKKLFLMAISVIVVLSALCFGVEAEESAEPTVKLRFARLVCGNQVYLQYAAEVGGVDNVDLSDVGMLVWKENVATRTEATATDVQAFRIDTDKTKGTKYYIMGFSDLSAKEMNDKVYTKPYVVVNGKRTYGDELEYSICTYAERQLGFIEGHKGTDDQNLVLLLRDMLRYGASAQRYFDYKTNELASDMLEDKIHVTYDLGFGEDEGVVVSNPNPSSFAFASGNVTLLAPEAKGYIFKGWYKDEDYENPVTEIDTSKPGDITLHAMWQPERYTITYTNTKGVDNPNEESFSDYGIEDSIQLQDLEKYDYTFNGWLLKGENGVTRVTEIPAGTTGNLTLSADWVLKPEFVGFNYVVDENYSIANGEKFCMLTGVVDEPNATSVKIPSVFNHIQSGALQNCHWLEELELPYLASDYTTSRNTNLGYMFGYGSNADAEAAGAIPSSLKKVTVNGGAIGEMAFANLKNVSEIVLTPEVTEIGFRAFSDFESLEELTMPLLYVNSAKQMEKNGGSELPISMYYGLPGSRNFNDSGNYTGNQFKLHINGGGIYYGAEKDAPNEVAGSNIGNAFGIHLFYNCLGISELTIDNITVVPEMAFGGCRNIKKITIGDTVEDIRAGAFFETAIEEIVIPDSVKEWGQYWYGDYSGYTRRLFGYETDSGNVFNSCENLKKVKIGNGVENIPAYMFSWCRSLEEITIGENVHFVDNRAFLNTNDTFEVINNSKHKEWVISDPFSGRFMNQLMTSENAPEKVYYGDGGFEEKQTGDSFTEAQIKDWNIVFYSPTDPYAEGSESSDLEYWYHEDGADWYKNQYTVTPKMWTKPQS